LGKISQNIENFNCHINFTPNNSPKKEMNITMWVFLTNKNEKTLIHHAWERRKTRDFWQNIGSQQNNSEWFECDHMRVINWNKTYPLENCEYSSKTTWTWKASETIPLKNLKILLSEKSCENGFSNKVKQELICWYDLIYYNFSYTFYLFIF